MYVCMSFPAVIVDADLRLSPCATAQDAQRYNYFPCQFNVLHCFEVPWIYDPGY